MPYKSQAELDEALRVGTVADASVEAVEDESTTASAEQTDGDAEGQAGDEPAASAEPEVPAAPKRKTRS